MKNLSKEEMKKVMGGGFDELTMACAPTCNVAHCYGTKANCQNREWGSCDGRPDCHEYCVVNGEAQSWC